MSFAVVFPGQGSQSVGMQAVLAAAYPEIHQTYAEASTALGYDLWQLVQDGPVERLNRTAVTQPAMLTAGVAVWRIWQRLKGKNPAFMAGHSLGEYTALVCAGSLDFATAVELVALRGEYMQEAVPAGVGAMAAVLGLDDALVAEACAVAAEDAYVEPANYNAPGQVVIAGEKAGVERAAAEANERGAMRVMMLPVSVPSHCRLMTPAAERLSAKLAETKVTAPSIPVIHNVDAAAHDDPEVIRELLARQLHQPVRWTDTIQSLIAAGVTEFSECGPGKVLAGMIKRIHRKATITPWQNPQNIQDALQACTHQESES